MAKEGSKFIFFVNDKKFETEQRYLTGAQIKTQAQLDLALQLFQEEHGHDKPDKLIGNDVTVDFEEPGIDRFYTVPAATFGLHQ